MSATTSSAERFAALTTIDEGLMEREVRDLMTPGVVTISDDASLDQVTRAVEAHNVHAILVVDASDGRPLGWVTARGLLGWLGRDRSLATARDAISEQVTTIEPSASVRAALYALSLPDVTRLVVKGREQTLPEGVITDFDLAAAASR